MYKLSRTSFWLVKFSFGGGGSVYLNFHCHFHDFSTKMRERERSLHALDFYYEFVVLDQRQPHKIAANQELQKRRGLDLDCEIIAPCANLSTRIHNLDIRTITDSSYLM